jgi:ribosomal protein S18 acetylase RimI-like enzyme
VQARKLAHPLAADPRRLCVKDMGESNMEIKYRSGEKKDCSKLAELINIASDGVVEYLFHDLIPRMTPVQVIAHNLENENYPHSYKSAIVATDKNDTVGMALSYPSSYHKITGEMRSFFPAERLEHLTAFYSSRVENTWFLDALCVIESHRRRGIGEKLISLTKERAIENGYNALSLIVFADNKLAIPVYEHTGFEVVQKVELRGNEFINHEDGCLLLKFEITT